NLISLQLLVVAQSLLGFTDQDLSGLVRNMKLLAESRFQNALIQMTERGSFCFLHGIHWHLRLSEDDLILFLSRPSAGMIYCVPLGIRLRISTKPRDPDNELYFAHGLFSATVREGLEQISTFLASHAREVVFLDFNHFYGVQNLHHEKLVQMLRTIFGDRLCPVVFAQEVSLKYLWEKEYQVLVFYHNPMALEVPFLWPGQMMPSPWANTTDPEKLIQFLQASVKDRRRKGTFFVSQVVLTPKAINHAYLKQLVLTRPHIPMPRSGKICITPPKCSRKERRRNF
uniref:Phosphatidylinositol-specific phospholipase C, X domain containing 3 n=1 Tax=Sinocyclocheilus grahami TaxID=75366 RepID=A0A672QFG8_SINGR